MPDFFFTIPAKIYFGIDAISRIGSFCIPYADRILLVTEAILYEKKTIDRVQEFLDKKGIKYITFDEVVPNVTSTAVNNGIKLARTSHVNGIIGLGGIKTLSIARCIAMGTTSSKSMDDFLSGAKPENEALPYIEIPTTCRNPFMLTDEYFITDARNRKGVSGLTQPDMTKGVLIDPVLSTSLPPKYTATTVMDTLLAGIEGYISNKNNFFSDLLFCDAIKTLGELLPLVLDDPDDVTHRYQASRAGLLTAMGLSICKAGIGTALSWAINASLMVPKSWVASILLPHVLEFHVTTSSSKLAQVAALLGEDVDGLDEQEAAHKAIDGARRLLGSSGIPARFRDFDLILDDMVEIAETAYSYEMIRDIPRSVTPEDMFTIIKAAY
ncbi:MAG: iron-containing alcohol dehydrogenase [Spirochaetales bacterium]|nr:iron-containing alcohol dehydrogenase [Spirochaetales bacterium]